MLFVKKSVKYSLVFITILIVTSTITLPVVAESPLVAVMPFEEGDLSWKGFRGDEILNGITQQVTDKLVKKEGLRVMERTRIDEIMKEQNLGSSGRVDPATAAEIGKIIGVETMILGTMTRMEVKETGGVSIGPLEASQVKAVVTLRGRIVDTTTAEILNSFKSSGEESKESISISLSKLKGLSFGTKVFANSVLGKCIEKTTSKFVNNIDLASLEKKESEKIEGEVVKVLGDKLIVNIGKNQKISEKQRGEISREIEVEELTDKISMPIGNVEVISLEDNAAIVRIIETEEGESPQKGDMVSFELR